MRRSEGETVEAAEEAKRLLHRAESQAEELRSLREEYHIVKGQLVASEERVAEVEGRGRRMERELEVAREGRREAAEAAERAVRDLEEAELARRHLEGERTRLADAQAPNPAHPSPLPASQSLSPS